MGRWALCIHKKEPEEPHAAKLRRYAVSASLLGAIQRLVCRLDHLVRGHVAVIPLRDADADRDDDGLPALATLVVLGLQTGAKPAPHGKPAGFHQLAQLFERRQAFVLPLARKHECEFLTAIAICGPAARCLGEARRDEPPYVVAGVVAIGGIEAL